MITGYVAGLAVARSADLGKDRHSSLSEENVWGKSARERTQPTRNPPRLNQGSHCLKRERPWRDRHRTSIISQSATRLESVPFVDGPR